MRWRAYMKCMGFVAATAGLAAGVWSAPRQPADTGKQQAKAMVNGNCVPSTFDSATLDKELARMQREWKSEAAAIETRAQQAKAEVARAMAEQGIRRAEIANLAARMQTEKAAIESQARDASAQAQQLFMQAPGIFGEDTGWLGLEMKEVSPEKAEELKISPVHGVVVTEVLPDSPAARAGLEPNDVIVEYDGHEVEGAVQFGRLVRETPPGRSVNVTVIRGGKEKRLTVQVGSAAHRMESEMREIVPPREFNFKFKMPNMPELFAGTTPVLGIEAEDVSGQLGEYFHVPGDEGVLVREVSPETPAARAGLKAGDVITRVGGVEVRTVSELREQLQIKREQKTVALTIVRNGSPITITVKLEPETRAPMEIRAEAM